VNCATVRAVSPADADPQQARILVVESNARVGHKLVEHLCADRYRAILARTPGHARALARAEPLRAIVLCALDSPHGALDLLEEIRRSDRDSHDGSAWDECLPAIVLSQRAEQLDMLRAFEMGADDFIGGKHSYLEVRARLGAVLRRSEGFPATRLLRAGPLEIDTRAHVVLVRGVVVELRRLEYELLVHLARDPSGVCSKRELLRSIWRERAGAGARTVDSHASRLRRKLDAAGAPGLVVNVWGVGYRLT
jgi:DNA-binding response OmpR family regulator